MGGFSFQCNLCDEWCACPKEHLRQVHNTYRLSPEQLKRYNKIWHKEPPPSPNKQEPN